ncbi:MAG TPA: oligosaccharide flippase family protein [Jatrophihabitantaceae bacterium]|nr:oligosaccharide flippase family protein [Jatrophihabitantaceae bacterium]
MILSAAARLGSFVPIAIATLLTSRLIIRHFGVHDFDSFSLIISLILLVPLQDLGVGAAVTSSMAEFGPDTERTKRVLLTAARVLTLSALGLVVGSAVLGAAGVWHSMLGASSGSNALVATALAVYAVSFVPGLGQPLLLGMHRNHMVVLIQTLYNPLNLLGVAVLISFGVDGAWTVIVPPASVVAVNLFTAAYAFRAAGLSLWRDVLRKLPYRHRYRGGSIRNISGPMLVITLGIPLALQSDRIVLSHVSSSQAVAEYSVAVQIFAPVVALIAASAQPLWPIWIQARAQGKSGPGLTTVLAIFCGATALISLVLVVISDPIGHIIGGRSMNLGVLLPVSAGLAMVMQSAAYPVAMALMDPRGIRFVAVCTLIAVPLNVGLSVVLAEHIGAPGPLLATFIVGVLVQTLPGVIYANGRSSAPRHRHDPRMADSEQVPAAALLAAYFQVPPQPPLSRRP